MHFNLTFLMIQNTSSQTSLYRKCKTQEDCSVDECCAFWRRGEVKFCKKNLLRKQRCYPLQIVSKKETENLPSN